VLALLTLLRQTRARPALRSVGLYGVGTIVFGLSRSFSLSVAAYGDEWRIKRLVLRSTTIQLTTPDELRGRVTPSASSSSARRTSSAPPVGIHRRAHQPDVSVVSGGVATLAVVAIVGFVFRSFGVRSSCGNRALTVYRTSRSRSFGDRKPVAILSQLRSPLMPFGGLFVRVPTASTVDSSCVAGDLQTDR
jgi:hypothetical protein